MTVKTKKHLHRMAFAFDIGPGLALTGIKLSEFMLPLVAPLPSQLCSGCIAPLLGLVGLQQPWVQPSCSTQLCPAPHAAPCASGTQAQGFSQKCSAQEPPQMALAERQGPAAGAVWLEQMAFADPAQGLFAPV